MNAHSSPPLRSLSNTTKMDSYNCDFGQLKIGAVFRYHKQTYRKDGEITATMLQWADGDKVIGEQVSHRFFPEIVVQISDSEDENTSKTD